MAWQPEVGPETRRLLAATGLPDGGEGVLDQALEVLGRCVSPAEADQRTGLVVGYVQSGKTLSFTTVTTLARDNGYPLVILLVGTKRNLHGQTSERLWQDLKVARPGGIAPWKLYTDVAAVDPGVLARDAQDMLRDGPRDEYCRTSVVTVMKNPAKLKKLRELLHAVSCQPGLSLERIPVVIVDDEADQAGLNAGGGDAEDATPTYRAIVDLRKMLPRHTYLMYTATPQAPLLVALADTLSPDFVFVLEPGAGYRGGRFFFQDHAAEFVHRLTADEADDATTSLEAPPPSLVRALATFFLTAAAQQENQQIASMLVHPDRSVALHGTYRAMVGRIQTGWIETLREGGDNRQDLIDTHFLPAYRDLARSRPRISSLDDLVVRLERLIGRAEVVEVNGASEAGKLQWDTAPAWVLVGGNKLDRGFTVEGLTTTYMPRGTGGGQVDTLQQRARFFGYKASYADLCRAWLADDVVDAFTAYVQHEEVLRDDLKEVARRGENLKTWKRRMLLDPDYKATRRTVTKLGYRHDAVRGGEWHSFGRVLAGRSDNPQLLDALVRRYGGGLADDPRDGRPRTHKNRCTLAPLSELLNLLSTWEVAPEEQVTLTQLCLLLSWRLDEHPGLDCGVYLMDDLEVRRRTPKNGRIDLPQGRDPSGRVYPGDDTFFSDGVVSVQVHNIQLFGSAAPPTPALRVRVPGRLAGGVLVQDT